MTLFSAILLTTLTLQQVKSLNTPQAPLINGCEITDLNESNWNLIDCKNENELKILTYTKTKNIPNEKLMTDFDKETVTIVISENISVLINAANFKHKNRKVIFLGNKLGKIPAEEMINNRTVIKKTTRYKEWIIGNEEINYWGAAKGNPVNCSSALNTQKKITISECYYFNDASSFLNILNEFNEINWQVSNK